MSSAAKYIEDHTFQGGFHPESVLISGGVVAGVAVAAGFGLASGAISGVGDDAAAKAIGLAILIVAMTLLVAIMAGIMDKRKNVRYGSIAAGVAVLGLVIVGIRHFKSRLRAGRPGYAGIDA